MRNSYLWRAFVYFWYYIWLFLVTKQCKFHIIYWKISHPVLFSVRIVKWMFILQMFSRILQWIDLIFEIYFGKAFTLEIKLIRTIKVIYFILSSVIFSFWIINPSCLSCWDYGHNLWQYSVIVILMTTNLS